MSAIATKNTGVAPELVTGTYDSGDVLENVLDELRAVLAATIDLHSGGDHTMGNLLYMAQRKAEAAGQIYDHLRSMGDIGQTEDACDHAAEE